jgi:hypothetical protein
MSTRAEVALKALVSFAVGIILATLATISYVDGRIAHASAQAAADGVGPVAARLSEHLVQVEGARQRMEEFIRTDREMKRAIARNLFELCRANRGVKCEALTE